MMQIQKKRLSKSFSEFTNQLKEEERESFYLKIYTDVEAEAIKNIEIDELLIYYSMPSTRKNETEFDIVKNDWFYCFEYCKQWEANQNLALQEQKDIDAKGKVFYDDFMANYQLLDSELNRLIEYDFLLGDHYEQFFYTLQKHYYLKNELNRLPSMNSIDTDYYTPLMKSISGIDNQELERIRNMLIKGHLIYGTYWSFMKGKTTHFDREIENQIQAESEFDKSIKNLINYSIQHSNGKFKDMYKALAEQFRD